ncbi:uncharacterized protein F5147DRAFT_773583 [Suillus discolor]|uniref:Uncharacterized protein n=1 Tax=Suillus discolor TaxID=1912936 RepID=A0A9P7F7F4_9AGAM|nr:uncharacterized protein F5147DRAFT_773583 [Suillus discolor]KAG2108371.1 hypothetical protein F5147DRAFT_773583 [Suillus discolor]
MVASHETADDGVSPHPYWYARVLGIHHVMVEHPSIRKATRMEFLRVRWFGRDPDWASGPGALRLDRIGYVPDSDDEAFRFLVPSHVLRACHLIPAFALGKTMDLLGPSKYRDSDEGDWVNYYVMRYIDRDMMMRYLGTGIGHMHPPGFPNETQSLQIVSEDRYVPPATRLDKRTICDVSEDSDSDAWNEDGSEKDFDENVYEL